MTRRGDSLVWKPGGKAKWDYTVGSVHAVAAQTERTGAESAIMSNSPKPPSVRSSAAGRQHPGLQGRGIPARRAQSGQDSAGALAAHPRRALSKSRRAVAQATRHPAAHRRRRVLAQAAIHEPDVARWPLHGRAVLRRVRQVVQRTGCRFRRHGQTDPADCGAHLRPGDGIVLSRLGRNRRAAVGEPDDRHVIEFLGPRHRLVCHGPGGRAGLFPDESSGAAGNHRHVPEIMRGRGEISGSQDRPVVAGVGSRAIARAITWKRRLRACSFMRWPRA